MPATKYAFSVSSDFPNSIVDSDLLKSSIEASGSIATVLQHIDTMGDVCDVWFEDALSSGEETALDALVAAHDGQPCVTGIQKATDNSEQEESAGNWTEALAITSGKLGGGDYYLQVSLELKIQNQVDLSGVQVRVSLNGNEQVAMSSALTTYDVRYIAAPVSFNPLDAPNISVEFRAVGAANTAKVRRVRVALVPLGM